MKTNLELKTGNSTITDTLGLTDEVGKKLNNAIMTAVVEDKKINLVLNKIFRFCANEAELFMSCAIFIKLMMKTESDKFFAMMISMGKLPDSVHTVIEPVNVFQPDIDTEDESHNLLAMLRLSKEQMDVLYKSICGFFSKKREDICVDMAELYERAENLNEFIFFLVNFQQYNEFATGIHTIYPDKTAEEIEAIMLLWATGTKEETDTLMETLNTLLKEHWEKKNAEEAEESVEETTGED
jgi:hypothetical protein